jgi:putative transposase
MDAHPLNQSPAALAFGVRRGLRRFVVEAGLEALDALLEAEREQVCGKRYRHDPNRTAIRAGRVHGEVVLAGRKVRVSRPRVRTADGAHEIPLPSWQEFSSRDPLDQTTVEQILVGVTTRQYHRAIEALPGFEQRGTSRSAVSRRFVDATRKQLADWLDRDLSNLSLGVVMIDGIAFGTRSMVLVALGIDERGVKHVLGIREGGSESADLCGALLDDLIRRGVSPLQSRLFVVDGSKALATAIKNRFGDRGVIQRCQVHKVRNVIEYLPSDLRPAVVKTMQDAFASRDFPHARRTLQNLARRLDRTHPDAAASVREGLTDTLTVTRLGLPESFAPLVASTNAIENLNKSIRRVTRNVTRWRNSEQILRWVCAAVRDAESRFQPVPGAASGMTVLLRALRAHDRALEARCARVTSSGRSRRAARG